MIMLAMLTVVLGVTRVYATNKTVEITPERFSRIAEMAIHYYIEPQEEEPVFESDPIMQEIWVLRGNELRTYMDFSEVFRMAKVEFYTQNMLESQRINDARLTKLAQAAQQSLFSSQDFTPLEPISSNEAQFIDTIQNNLKIVMDGQSNQLFSQQYKLQRDVVIELVEKNGYKLYTYDPNVLEQIRQVTNSIQTSCDWMPSNNHVYDNYFYGGITGFTSKEARIGTQTDCDYAVGYGTNGSAASNVKGINNNGWCVINNNKRYHGGVHNSWFNGYSGNTWVIFGRGISQLCFVGHYDLRYGAAVNQ